MNDFEFYFRKSIYLFEIACAIVATFTYKTYRNTPAKIFLPFLWFTVLTESFGEVPWIFRSNENGYLIRFLKSFMSVDLLTSSTWIYNIYSIISFYVFVCYYKKLTYEAKIYNKIILLLLFTYTLSVVIDFTQNFEFFNSKNVMINNHKIVGVFCTLISTFLYMQIVLRSDEILTFHKTLPFWITVGLLFFNLVTIPIFIFAQQLQFSEKVYVYILTLSNYIMYGSFIIGFVKNARQQKQNISLTN